MSVFDLAAEAAPCNAHQELHPSEHGVDTDATPPPVDLAAAHAALDARRGHIDGMRVELAGLRRRWRRDAPDAPSAAVAPLVDAMAALNARLQRALTTIDDPER